MLKIKHLGWGVVTADRYHGGIFAYLLKYCPYRLVRLLRFNPPLGRAVGLWPVLLTHPPTPIRSGAAGHLGGGWGRWGTSGGWEQGHHRWAPSPTPLAAAPQGQPPVTYGSPPIAGAPPPSPYPEQPQHPQPLSTEQPSHPTAPPLGESGRPTALFLPP